MKYTVPLQRVIDEFSLETIYMPLGEHVVESKDVNRPGLRLSGFCDFFDPRRIQLIGKMETAYLSSLTKELRYERIENFVQGGVPAIVVTTGLDPLPEFVELTEKYQIPLLLTRATTSAFIAMLISFLSVQLAERINIHGVLVEIYGEGVLITGDSGVGKSETAIELIKRGHRIIADDAVEVRRVSEKTLVGQSPENIRHFMELRGIGIVDARSLFGMGSVKPTEKIDLYCRFEHWDRNKVYDRTGLDNHYTTILGVKVRSITIPVSPGRNLAIILEVAAMNSRQKKMGLNAAQEMFKGMGMDEHPQEIIEEHSH